MGQALPTANIPTSYFLDTIQPEGNHYLAWIEPGKLAKHKVYDTSDEAVELSRKTYMYKHNVYFALASFKERTRIKPGNEFASADRTVNNVAAIRSLFIDLDFKNYASPADATRAMMAFLQESNLPKPSYLVHSGGGYHIYWALQDVLGVPEWLVLAKGLRALCKHYSLLCDHQVTIDAARILRMPGTMNRKDPENPVECKILGGTQTRYDLATIMVALQGYTEQPEGPNELGFTADSNVVNMFTGANADLTNRTPFMMATVAQGCGVVADSLAREGDGDAYPLWKNLLHLASFAGDGEEYIHKLSRGHPSYSAEETVARYEESLQAAATSGMGPTTCETFSGLSDKCKTCPLQGSIKSPASVKVIQEDGGRQVAATPEHADPSYVRAGWTYRLVAEKNPEGEGQVWSEKAVINKELTNFRYCQSINGPGVQFDHKHGVYETLVEIAITDLHDIGAMKSILSRAGVVFTPAQANNIQSILMAWIDKLQKARNSKTSAAFGWVYKDGKLDGFAVNAVLYKRDGTTDTSGVVDPYMRQAYEPTGTQDAWNAVARIVERDARGEVHMLMATAFASPLMAIRSDANAFTFSFYSRQSGVGKSANLMAAQAVWGHPKRAASSLNDTVNAVTEKMGKTTGLPGYWDELDKDRVAEFVGLMFHSTQGRSKQRLSQSGEMRETHELSGMLVSCSNDPVIDNVMRYRDGNAGLFRFFQVPMPARSASPGNFDSNFETMVADLQQNYAHVGHAYARYLAANVDTMLMVMKQVRDMVVARLGAVENERFWRHALVCLISGAMLAQKAGLIKLNTTAIFKRFEQLVLDGRVMTGDVEQSTNFIPAEVMNYFQNRVMIVRRLPSRGMNRHTPNEVFVDVAVNQPIKVAVGVDDGKVVFPMSSIDEYCQRHEKHLSTITQAFTELGGVKQKMTVGAHTGRAHAGRVACMLIDWDKVMDSEDRQRLIARAKALKNKP